MVFINSSNEFCQRDYFTHSTVCHLRCPNGKFALPGMPFCHSWLGCEAKITILSLISLSVVKSVYLAKWEGYPVVASVLSSQKYEKDFFHNLDMIKLYAPNDSIINFIGHCKNSILTEYHKFGNALNLPYLLRAFKPPSTLDICFNLCISYVSILSFLHNSVDGARVMCDSNDLEKALSQFLITTDLQLVLNDLDATPKVNVADGGIHCGNKELFGSLLAPEQIWPYPDINFDANEMPYYDEKTDIYKVPDICMWFLGHCPDADVLKYKLHDIHKRCKNVDPYKRPSADFVLKEYKVVYNSAIKIKQG